MFAICRFGIGDDQSLQGFEFFQRMVHAVAVASFPSEIKVNFALTSPVAPPLTLFSLSNMLK